jgi:hypothetical protein
MGSTLWCVGWLRAWSGCSGSAQACSGSAPAYSPSAQVRAAVAHVRRLKQNQRKGKLILSLWVFQPSLARGVVSGLDTCYIFLCLMNYPGCKTCSFKIKEK